MVQQSFVSPGLMNGDRLVGTAVCPGALLSGGYAVLATNPPDLEKLIPSLDFPSDAQTWTVMVVANANVQPFVLTVFATCTS
jgi:heme A synthase